MNYLNLKIIYGNNIYVMKNIVGGGLFNKNYILVTSETDKDFEEIKVVDGWPNNKNCDISVYALLELARYLNDTELIHFITTVVNEGIEKPFDKNISKDWAIKDCLNHIYDMVKKFNFCLDASDFINVSSRLNNLIGWKCFAESQSYSSYVQPIVLNDERPNDYYWAAKFIKPSILKVAGEINLNSALKRLDGIKVLEASGYNDGCYWDMNATIEWNEEIYHLFDGGSGSGYNLCCSGIIKDDEFSRLYGEEQNPIDIEDEDYIARCISGLTSEFEEYGCKKSYSRNQDDHFNYHIFVDDVEIIESECFEEKQ